MMSRAVFELTKQQIEIGYEKKDEQILEKETDYIFCKIVTTILSLFPDKIKGIQFDRQSLALTNEILFSEKHKKNLFKWLNRLIHLDSPCSDLEFGKLKIDFEHWYYELSGEHIEFIYEDSYLLTPQQAAEALGISKVTLNKYIKQGLECLDNKSHKKIPAYTVEIMKDPVYSILMQKTAQEKKLRNQTPKERLAEINSEIAELQLKYGKETVDEAFDGYNGDEMNDPTDYYLWQDLEKEKREIIKMSGGKKT